MPLTILQVCEFIGRSKNTCDDKINKRRKSVKKEYSLNTAEKIRVHHLIPKSIHPYGYLDKDNLFPLPESYELRVHELYSIYELAMNPFKPIINVIEMELMASK